MSIYREIPKAAREKNKAAFFKNGSSVRKELVQLHCHDGYEVLYIRRGRGEQTINGRRMAFCQGDVVIIRPGEGHATLASEPQGCDVDVVQFFASFLQDDGEGLNALRSGVMHPHGEDFARAFDMLSDLDRFAPCSKAMVREGLIRLVCGLCVQLCMADAPASPSDPIAQLCAFLESAEELGLKAVAQRFGYSPEHLSRRFKREMGIGFREWCDRIRMRRATEMLSRGELALCEIAAALGYCEESSFVRAFRRVYGMTPGSYRRHLIHLGD